MSTAWQKLLEASVLTTGTAWQLLSAPKTGTGGSGPGLVVNGDGVTVELAENPFEVSLVNELQVILQPVEIYASVEASPVGVQVDSSPITVAVDMGAVEIELEVL